ncbi:retropepsin-like aspartic protease [Cryomorphaceae bacterium 1068]|nr:retropepsin-like aspartic protease [Cryomorphaceae bacterium 1068]
MKFIPFVFSFLFLAQSQFHDSAPKEALFSLSTTDPEATCDVDVVTIPFKRAGRLLIIEAQVDSLRGNFIFDTGAPYLILNRTYFRDYKKRKSANAKGITGASNLIDLVRVESLKLKNISYANLDADLINLGEIENVRGIKVLGLLGLNLFKGFEMEIDVRNNVLKLYKTDKDGNCIKAPPTFKCEITQSIGVFDNTVFTDCYIAGKKLRFGFDTGAETNALNSRVNKKVLETISITGRRSLSGVGEGNVEILFGRLNDFQISNNTILGMQTLITNLDGISDVYGTQIDGMLGFDFLAKGVVRINCKKNYLKLCLFDKFSSE